MKKDVLKYSTILISCILLTTTTFGQKFIKETGTGTQDGSSWDNALPGTALTTTLNTAGDVKVYIAAGNYEITANITISNKNFYLKGGYPANATGSDTSLYAYQANKTVIRESAVGTINRRFQIGVGSSANQTNVMFQGLIFTSFINTAGPGVFDINGGAGTLNIDLLEVDASGNTGSTGGVLSMVSVTGANKHLTVDKCVFSGNTSTGFGGVFYFSTVYNIPPGTNTGIRGGDNHSFRILNSALRNNLSADWGGAFFITTGADFLIANNYLCSEPNSLISSGSVASYGGIFGLTTTNRISISDNVFTGGRITGTGTNGGAAIFTQTINAPGNLVNANRFFDNTGTSGPRPDIYVTATMNLTISNNLFDKSNQASWIEGQSGSISTTTFTNNTNNENNFVPDCPVYIPLPVTLINFEAKKESLSIKLLWATASEVNNRGFEIQRSGDAKNFATIGFMNSKSKDGNSKELLNYEYRDYTAVNGKVYYRLVQIDSDHKTTTSKIIAVSNENDPGEISIFPNPIKDKVHVSGLKGNEQIYIYDQTGKMIYDQQVFNTATDINLERLDNGVYYFHIIAKAGKVLYRKMVIKID